MRLNNNEGCEVKKEIVELMKTNSDKKVQWK